MHTMSVMNCAILELPSVLMLYLCFAYLDLNIDCTEYFQSLSSNTGTRDTTSGTNTRSSYNLLVDLRKELVFECASLRRNMRTRLPVTNGFSDSRDETININASVCSG